MEEGNKEVISYFAHEGMMARMERIMHRQWITIIILIVCLIVTNLAWVLYKNSFEETTTMQEVTQSAESENGTAHNSFVGGDYGESNPDSKNNN